MTKPALRKRTLQFLTNHPGQSLDDYYEVFVTHGWLINKKTSDASANYWKLAGAIAKLKRAGDVPATTAPLVLPWITREELLAECHRVVKAHKEKDIDLSIRAVYYNLVGEFVMADRRGERVNYRRVVETVAEAKKAGEFPLEWLIDSLREPAEASTQKNDFTYHSLDVARGLAEMETLIQWAPGHYIRTSRWYGQDKLVLVMYEKDTLTGVLKKPCKDAGVTRFVCRGYPSVTGLTALANIIERYLDEASDVDWEIQELRLIYIGDFDPDGTQIPTSALEVLEIIRELSGYNWPPLVIERVALTKAQALATGKPSMGVKMTSSRAPKFVEEHGNEAWEVEALDAELLQNMLTTAIAAHRDDDLHVENQARAARARVALIKRMTPAWLAATIEGL